ncbi:MAG: FkbM family methyltransferase, partial [Proteobacteria bacterium]|nr:FkbM family methyltransferase [Pseudomonadota bacterium]
MTDVPDLIVGGRPPRNPFRAEKLPLIARLSRAGFHTYRRRWAKRLFKKPTRLAFDIAFHGLKLGGRGTMVLDIPGGERHLDFDARKVHFGSVYHNAYAEGYEPEVGAILETVLSGDRVFFDVGANWGYFALYAASIEGYSGTIHAFEPIAETFSDLESLTAQAGLGGRVHCHRLALSDRDGIGTMAFDSVNIGTARLVKDSDGGQGTAEVRLNRLDGLDLPTPWLVKLDVETHEFQALRGAETLLTREKPLLVFENWKERHDPQGTLRPLRYLEELGYAL